MSRGRPAVLASLLVLAACGEDALAPGACPDFCPGGSIGIADTVLTMIIERDSSFRGYLQPHEGEALAVADLPGIVDSRAIFRLNPMFTRVAPDEGDTATVPITADSARLRIQVVRRDTNATNLRLKIYRLPSDIDSTTTFAALTPWFTDSLVDSVNVSNLLDRPPIADSATLAAWGDTIRTDSAGHVLQIARSDSSLILHLSFDTEQARFVVDDSGRVAYGVRVAADSLASIALGAENVLSRDAQIRWFYSYPDTVIKRDSTVRGTEFDSFVFDPPSPALDDNLTVGGVPAARALVRVAIPSFLRDTVDVVRATLLLVPVAPVQGAPGDSFTVLARPVLADLGAKSPLNPLPNFFGSATIHIGSADTVRMELSDLIRAWARDTASVTTFVLGQLPEASTYAEVRFYSSRTPAFRPALHVTYVRRFAFGAP
ncbi:MAG: hypothetical protein ACREME_13310 [Gemmatimonadales bacterium]